MILAGREHNRLDSLYYNIEPTTLYEELLQYLYLSKHNSSPIGHHRLVQRVI